MFGFISECTINLRKLFKKFNKTQLYWGNGALKGGQHAAFSDCAFKYSNIMEI